MDNKNNTTVSDLSNFRIDRIQKLAKLYSDEASAARLQDRSFTYSTKDYQTAAEVRDALSNAINDRTNIVEASKKLYAINPIYSSVIEYLANMFLWRYKVVPHKIYTKSKARMRKKIADEDFNLLYNSMLEVVDGLNIETKFPSLLTLLFTTGAVYITTYCDEESITVDSILLPDRYCRKIGETQYGTAIIEFDFSYFQSLGLMREELEEYIKQFPSEFKKGYDEYLKNSSEMRWQQLDPRFSTGILLNDVSIPTFFYLYGSILDYEKYQDNELQRNENLLKYLVVQKMPIYQDKLVFELDEVAALHQSVSRIVRRNENATLITSFGDVEIQKFADNETAENQVLTKSFKSIFNNGGFNSAIFNGESVQALVNSIIRDKGMVWRYVQQITNFYSIAVNNWFDFKNYEADIDILQISPYTYSDDIEVMRLNATLGVGKLDYFIASGIKQKNIQDQLNLESFLGLDTITPMQTSYTQTAEDRETDDEQDNGTDQKTTKTNTNEDNDDSAEAPKSAEADSDESVIEPAE